MQDIYSEGQMVSLKSVFIKRLFVGGFVGFPMPSLKFLPCSVALDGPSMQALFGDICKTGPYFGFS